MRADIHPKYADAEIRCACGNVIKTRSTRSTIIVGICNSCHPFYTGQPFVDTAGRVDKFQQRIMQTQAAQASGGEEEEGLANFRRPPAAGEMLEAGGFVFMRQKGMFIRAIQ